MMTANAADLARTLAGVGVVYYFLPALARRWGRGRGEPLAVTVAAAHVEALFVGTVAASILGQWRLCLPGTLLAVYFGWLLLREASHETRWQLLTYEWWRERGLAASLWLEQRGYRGWLRRWDAALERRQWPEGLGLVLLVAAVILIDRSRFPLDNLRFLTEDSYSRALSLQTLIHGAAWDRNGAVAWLAPVAFASGLDAAALVRWSGPVVWLELALAAGYAGWVYGGRAAGAAVPIALVGLAPWVRGAAERQELGGAALAAAGWVWALGRLRHSRMGAFQGAVFALIADRHFTVWLAAAAGAVAFGVIASRVVVWMGTNLQRVLAVAGLVGLALGLRIIPREGIQDGPLQYEAAARAVARIASTFGKNQWMIISPAQEVPLLYGKGWHLELAEFVSSFDPREVGRREFAFPFPAADVFLFVEKRPLAKTAVSVPTEASRSAFLYNTKVGRATLQFQAAQLAAAYRRSHPGMSTYYEDQNLVVYRIRTGNGASGADGEPGPGGP